jgi:hypothetical protein
LLPFLTAYDPLGATSGSIDPLGALQPYVAMADRLLPGTSTITTRSRYLSMLCAALANAEKHRTFSSGSTGFTERRQAVEPYERLWALACVAAREGGVEGAADGLRGVTAAERRYRHYAANNEPIDLAFKLLKYQGRTGAVGTYWTSIVGSDLADPDSGALTAEGHELAKEFPSPGLSDSEMERLAYPIKGMSVEVTVDQLRAWGRRVNLVAPTAKEKLLLRDALVANMRRNCVYTALAELERTKSLPEIWNAAAIRALCKAIAEVEAAAEGGLHDLLEAILYFERAHEAVLRLFESVLWWGTDRPGSPANGLAQDADFRRRADRCVATAKALVAYWEKCPRPDLKSVLGNFTDFARIVARSERSKDVLEAVLRRHRDVQAGKLDDGVPKREWVTVNDDKVELPMPRFQLTKRPSMAAGLELTHAYRLGEFIHMLREVGALRPMRT